jgi:hypothetical protein
MNSSVHAVKWYNDAPFAILGSLLGPIAVIGAYTQVHDSGWGYVAAALAIAIGCPISMMRTYKKMGNQLFVDPGGFTWERQNKKETVPWKDVKFAFYRRGSNNYIKLWLGDKVEEFSESAIADSKVFLDNLMHWCKPHVVAELSRAIAGEGALTWKLGSSKTFTLDHKGIAKDDHIIEFSNMRTPVTDSDAAVFYQKDTLFGAIFFMRDELPFADLVRAIVTEHLAQKVPTKSQ